jgi:hypothetical protein
MNVKLKLKEEKFIVLFQSLQFAHQILERGSLVDIMDVDVANGPLFIKKKKTNNVRPIKIFFIF